MLIRRPTLLFILALIPFLGAGKCVPVKPPDVVVDDKIVDKVVQSVDNPVQVVSVRPDAVAPETVVEGRIFGSGFVQGASVTVGGKLLTKANVESDNSIVVTLPAMPVGSYDVVVKNPDQKQSTLRNGLRVDATLIMMVAECRHVRLFFAVNDVGLTDDARQLLQTKSSCWTNTQSQLVIEGHADERDTVDYNLGLAQRRADSVKRFLGSLGLTTQRMRSVSFGEEKPLEGGHDESAWSRNRRVEIKVQ